MLVGSWVLCRVSFHTSSCGITLVVFCIPIIVLFCCTYFFLLRMLCHAFFSILTWLFSHVFFFKMLFLESRVYWKQALIFQGKDKEGVRSTLCPSPNPNCVIIHWYVVVLIEGRQTQVKDNAKENNDCCAIYVSLENIETPKCVPGIDFFDNKNCSFWVLLYFCLSIHFSSSFTGQLSL